MAETQNSDTTKNISNKEVEIRGENGQKIDLSKKELESFEKFLRRQETKERKEIVYLTTKELEKFRNLLNETPQNESELEKFILNQEKETITNSEILGDSKLSESIGGIEKLQEISNVIEKASYEHFFGAEGALKNLNLSEDAKRNFSVGANFFMLDFLNKEMDNSGSQKDIQDSIEKIFGQESGALAEVFKGAGKVQSVLKGIKLVFEATAGKESIRKILGKVYKPDQEKILAEVLQNMKITDSEQKEDMKSSEKQAILMNPLKTKELLDLVYSEASKEDIEKYISENNQEKNLEFKEEDKQKLQEIGNKIAKNLGEESLGIIGQATEYVEKFNQIKDNIKDSISNNKEALELLGFLSSVPIIGDFIKTFLGFLGIKDINKLFSEKDFEASKKAISESIAKKGAMLEDKKIGDDFMKSNGGNDQVFANDIKYLVGDKDGKDFEAGVSKLFKKEGEFDKFTKNKSVNINFEGNNVNYESLKKAISLFVEYKQEKEKDKSLSMETFIEKKEKEKKAREDKRKQDKKDMVIISNAKKASKSVEIAKKDEDEANKKVKEEQIKVTTAKTDEARKKAEREVNRLKAEAEKAKEAKKEAERKAQEVIALAEEVKEKFTVKKAEPLKVSKSLASVAMEVGNNFYRIEATNDSFIITGNGENVEYSGGGEILNYLQKFKTNLDLEAKAEYFDPNTNGKGGTFEKDGKKLTTRQVLMEGFEGNIALKELSQQFLAGVSNTFSKEETPDKQYVNEKGLKQLFSENFFSDGKLKDSATIKIQEKDYTFIKKS